MRSLLTLACFMSTLSIADEFRFQMAERIITPPLMDTYEDRNGNLRRDDDEPWVDVNQNGTFDPYYMAGFGQNRVAASVHDDLKVTAASFFSEGRRVVLVSVDTIGWFQNDKNDVRKLLAQDYRVDLLLIHATHNHEAPDTIGLWGPDYFRSGVNRDYLDFIKRQMAAAIDEAVRGETPASMTLATRNEVPHDLGQIDSRPIPEVLDGRLITAQFHDRRDQRVLGTLVNFGNHVETLWSRNIALTADYPGFLREALQKGIVQDGKILLEGHGAPVLFLAGNIGGLATTSDDVPVRDPFTGTVWVEPSFEKAEAQGRYLAKLTDDLLRSPKAKVEDDPTLQFFSRSYELSVENLEFLLAGGVAKLISRPFEFKDWKWTVKTESHVVRVGGLSLLTVPGEVYPEIAVGGVDHPLHADFDVPPQEWPPLLDVMPGFAKMFANTCNDFLGYIIPRSEWDRKKPYITGTDDAPYGEGNSLGPKTAPEIHRQSLDLLLEARQATDPALTSPFTGQFLFALDQGLVDPFRMDALGRISGAYRTPQGNSYPVTGYVNPQGAFDFWIDAAVHARGQLSLKAIQGRYESRQHPGIQKQEAEFEAVLQNAPEP